MEKHCKRCGRVITWRKKWEDCWEEVSFCSKLCKGKRLSEKDIEIESLMLQLLRERGKGKSLCPSEPVRRLFTDDLWKAEMESARMAARRLVMKGEAVITQKGLRVDPSTARGPIRVKLI